MKTYIVGAVAAVAFALSAGAASAQTMSFAQAGALMAKSCGPSIERFCAKDNVGTGQIAQCLSQHQDEVPRQCFVDMQTIKESIDARLAAAAGLQPVRR